MELRYFFFLIFFGSNLSSIKVEGLQSEKIVGGTLASSVTLKYVVALIYRIDDQSFHCPCAGAILDDWHIATAAHCFYNKTDGKFIDKLFEIVVSTVNLDNPTHFTRYIRVRFVIMPERYDATEPDTYSKYGNLAIVKLKEHLGLLTHKDHLKELIIAKIKNRNPLNIYTVSGYGWNNTDRPPHKVEDYLKSIQTGQTDRRLRRAQARILTNEDCEKIIPGRLAKGNMCAIIIQKNPNKPSGICQFDSGAPLMHNKYLDGIAINGFSECDEEKMPGIYIKMLHYRHFIDNAMSGLITNNMFVIELEEKIEGNRFMFKTVRSVR